MANRIIGSGDKNGTLLSEVFCSLTVSIFCLFMAVFTATVFFANERKQ